MDKLLECPFCGDGEPVFSGSEYGSNFGCEKCGMGGPIVPKDGWNAAAKAWNRRHAPQVGGLLAECRERMKKARLEDDWLLISNLEQEIDAYLSAPCDVGGVVADEIEWLGKYIRCAGFGPPVEQVLKAQDIFAKLSAALSSPAREIALAERVKGRDEGPMAYAVFCEKDGNTSEFDYFIYPELEEARDAIRDREDEPEIIPLYRRALDLSNLLKGEG